MKTFKDSEKKVQDHRNAHLANLCTFVRNMLTTMICVVVKYLSLLVFCVKSFKHIMCLREGVKKRPFSSPPLSNFHHHRLGHQSDKWSQPRPLRKPATSTLILTGLHRRSLR